MANVSLLKYLCSTQWCFDRTKYIYFGSAKKKKKAKFLKKKVLWGRTFKRIFSSFKLFILRNIKNTNFPRHFVFFPMKNKANNENCKIDNHMKDPMLLFHFKRAAHHSQLLTETKTYNFCNKIKRNFPFLFVSFTFSLIVYEKVRMNVRKKLVVSVMSWI